MLLQKPVNVRAVGPGFLTDKIGNHKFGKNIATGKSCRVFLAPTSKMLPCAFSFSSSCVILKMGHNLFLLHMRYSRDHKVV